MAFCDHCQGQRFDRSRVLRRLRALRKELHAARCGPKADDAIVRAIAAIRSLDIPHLEWEDDLEDVVIH
jgi:hypothetical protein